MCAEEDQPQPFVGQRAGLIARVGHRPLSLLLGARIDDEQRFLAGGDGFRA